MEDELTKKKKAAALLLYLQLHEQNEVLQEEHLLLQVKFYYFSLPLSACLSLIEIIGQPILFYPRLIQENVSYEKRVLNIQTNKQTPFMYILNCTYNASCKTMSMLYNI